MMQSKKVFINRVTHFHPSGIIDNKKFEETLDTTGEWIEKRVGIKERRYMNDYTDSMPVNEISDRAYQRHIERFGSLLRKPDLIISCGTHDDMHYPNPANLLSEKYGIEAPALQIKVACTSVVYAISIAQAYILSGQAEHVLIINGEPFTRFIDFGDRSSCILFGDCANILEVSNIPEGFEIVGADIHGKGFKIVEANRTSDTSHFTPNEFATGTLAPNTPMINRRRNSDKKFQQDGKAVVDFVLSNVPQSVSAFIKKHSTPGEAISYFICHQSNLSMMNELFKLLTLPNAKHIHNIEHFGNTGSAGWISVLSQNFEQIQKDQIILVASFGAGMTWGNLLLKRT